jgi:hypothetical protein
MVRYGHFLLSGDVLAGSRQSGDYSDRERHDAHHPNGQADQGQAP